MQFVYHPMQFVFGSTREHHWPLFVSGAFLGFVICIHINTSAAEEVRDGVPELAPGLFGLRLLLGRLLLLLLPPLFGLLFLHADGLLEGGLDGGHAHEAEVVDAEVRLHSLRSDAGFGRVLGHGVR